MAETGIVWGGLSGHEYIGVNVRWDTIGAATTQSHVYADFYAQTTYAFADNQTLTFGGSLGGAWAIRLDTPNGSTTRFLGTYDIGVHATSYAGGPSWTFAASISQAWDGSAPSVSYGFTLPARPTAVPDQVMIPLVNGLTSASANVSWNAPAANGAAIDHYVLSVAYDAAFSSVVYHQVVYGATTVSGLLRATPYYARVIAHNAVGYGAWSAAQPFTTAATVPDAPSSVLVSAVGPETATLAWSLPANGGSALTGHEVQYATDASFTTNVVLVTATASPKVLVGLSPGTAYHSRARGVNAVGPGAWSADAPFETLSGMRVKVSGSWLTARVWVKVAGTWRLAKVWKKVGGVWRL